MSIKTSRTGKRFVERFREVGGCNDDDTFGLFKAVKFHKKLIQSLFHIMLILSTSFGANSIELINENDRGSLLPGSSEQLPDTFSCDQSNQSPLPLQLLWPNLPPTPTNISSKLEPEANKNGTSASPATARASIVLPVPGGPVRSTPFGSLPPRAENFSGFLRNSTISSNS